MSSRTFFYIFINFIKKNETEGRPTIAKAHEVVDHMASFISNREDISHS